MSLGGKLFLFQGKRKTHVSFDLAIEESEPRGRSLERVGTIDAERPVCQGLEGCLRTSRVELRVDE